MMASEATKEKLHMQYSDSNAGFNQMFTLLSFLLLYLTILVLFSVSLSGYMKWMTLVMTHGIHKQVNDEQLQPIF